MPTVTEHTYTNDAGSKRIRAIQASDGLIWCNAADVTAACGYAKVSSAIAACKGSCERRTEADGELYFSVPSFVQIAGRKGYNAFLNWVLRTIVPLGLAKPTTMPTTTEAPVSSTSSSSVPIVPRDVSCVSSVDGVMQAIGDGLVKQIEVQALAMSCKVLRESGMPYEMQKDTQSKLANKIVELCQGERADDYISAGQILLERGVPQYSVSMLESEFGKDLMLLARKEKLELPPMNLHKHHELKDGCCRVWHRVHHAELIEDVLESFRQRPLWGECVSDRVQRRFRLDTLQNEGRGRKKTKKR
jgi:hypothetical protein